MMDVKDIQSRMVSESGRRETCDGCERYTIQNGERVRKADCDGCEKYTIQTVEYE